MNSDEARQILQVYRAGGQDASDPKFAEALALLKTDLELAQWFDEQRRFDRQVAVAVQSVVVPGDLRDSLMASRRIVRPAVSWWRPAWNDWRVRAAVAAAVVFFASVAGTFSQRGPTRFADFRKLVVQEGWAGQSHLAYRSDDLLRVKQWLARNGGPTEFHLPVEFQNHRLHGCDVIHVDGHPVAVLCLASGSKHMHLFVAQDVQFADLPKDGVPDFEKCGPWRTAAWRRGDNTYVLSGVDSQAFMNTFRKAGRWTFSG